MKISKRKTARENKLIYGVGINDADYVQQVRETVICPESGRRIQKLIWLCPFYRRWFDMLRRCYSLKFQSKTPSYIGCSVVTGWLTFSNFKSWMAHQDWEGKDLDKDILIRGNKEYGPETCCFVSREVNLFVTERGALKGEYPIGAHLHNTGKFMSQCWDVVTGKRKHLGLFNSAEEAHKAWLAFKLEQAYIVASRQTDSRVAKALIFRYESFDQKEEEKLVVVHTFTKKASE